MLNMHTTIRKFLKWLIFMIKLSVLFDCIRFPFILTIIVVKQEQKNIHKYLKSIHYSRVKDFV